MNFIYNNMPVLTPLPLLTKNIPYFSALKKWFTPRKWKLEEDFKFNMHECDCYIPKGFIFDGASVPRIFWAILNPTGILLIGGLIHDYVYKFQEIPCEDGQPIYKKSGRAFYDQLMYDICYSVNGFFFINLIVYYTLRIFGMFAWNKHRENI